MLVYWEIVCILSVTFERYLESPFNPKENRKRNNYQDRLEECWSSNILEINQYSYGRINLVAIDIENVYEVDAR